MTNIFGWSSGILSINNTYSYISVVNLQPDSRDDYFLISRYYKVKLINYLWGVGVTVTCGVMRDLVENCTGPM